MKESISQKILNCYNTGCDIVLEPGQYKDITTEDIIAIIQLSHDRFNLKNKNSLIEATEFDWIDTNDDGLLTVLRDMELPYIVVILLIIIIPIEYEHITCRRVVGFNSQVLDYPDKERFLELAIETGIINYDITRHILGAFNIQYQPDTTLGTLFLQNYLRINTKSAREI